MKTTENELATLGFTYLRNLLREYRPQEGFFGKSQNQEYLKLARDLSQAMHNFPSDTAGDYDSELSKKALVRLAKEYENNYAVRDSVNFNLLIELHDNVTGNDRITVNEPQAQDNHV